MRPQLVLPPVAPQLERLGRALDLIALRRRLKGRLGAFLQPLSRRLAQLGVHPNTLSLLGLAVLVLAAIFLVLGARRSAAWLFLLGSLFDALDGHLARLTQKASPFGAFLDSTVDRLQEGIFLSALIYVLSTRGEHVAAAFAGLALTFSLTVSYARARAESLGMSCEEGWFTRPERVLLLFFGLLTGQLALAVYLLALATFLTTLQRIHHVYQNGSR